MFMRNKFGWNSRDEITHKLDSGETKDKRLVIDLSGNDYKKLDDKE
jgi:mRNA-degrading endonuclease HigB of HigAB toxin-antitoxin module